MDILANSGAKQVKDTSRKVWCFAPILLHHHRVNLASPFFRGGCCVLLVVWVCFRLPPVLVLFLFLFKKIGNYMDFYVPSMRKPRDWSGFPCKINKKNLWFNTDFYVKIQEKPKKSMEIHRKSHEILKKSMEIHKKSNGNPWENRWNP